LPTGPARFAKALLPLAKSAGDVETAKLTSRVAPLPERIRAARFWAVGGQYQTPHTVSVFDGKKRPFDPLSMKLVAKVLPSNSVVT
jgi:hypothetical protein